MREITKLNTPNFGIPFCDHNCGLEWRSTKETSKKGGIYASNTSKLLGLYGE